MSEYTLFLDLVKEVQPPDKGILRRLWDALDKVQLYEVLAVAADL